jgi:hypothetical protein
LQNPFSSENGFTFSQAALHAANSNLPGVGKNIAIPAYCLYGKIAV